MNPTHPTAQFLRQHRWRARGTLLAWSFAVTLATGAFLLAANLGWTAYSIGWALGPIAGALALLVWWFRRAPRLTSRYLAHTLDTRWALRARLETAVELAQEDSAFAKEQRNEATQKIAGKKAPGAFFWFLGLLTTAAFLSLLSVEGTALALRHLRKKIPPPKIASVPSEEAKETAKPATPVPPEFHAAIEWKSPDSEIKATAIEEVPLTAIADSTTGFKSVSLEMVVNGERELSRPLDDAMITVGATPGAHEFTPSLYLDELDVKVGDIVSYRLVGELNTPEKRTVTSPLQFVEIRATQKDRLLRGGPISPIAQLILELKTRQLALLKENFALAQSGGPQSDSSWNETNARVAQDQESLTPRVAELSKLVRAGPSVPPGIPDKLKELESLVHEAAEQIAAKDNARATKTQSRALAILAELSTFIRQALSGPSSPESDPFEDQQTFKLAPRGDTPAGQLEALAERQQASNQQMGGTPGAGSKGSGNSGDMKAEQAAIAEAAEKLAAGGGLDPEALAALNNGTSAAADAARQLGLGDTTAARVPAASALRSFQEAAAAQDKAGRATAAAELEQLRRTLNAAARANASERTQQMKQVRDALRSAANEQQRTGSADAARELAQLAELATAATPERAREIAAAAAQVQVGLMPRGAAISRAVRLLNRNGPPSAGTGSGGATLDDLELAAQEAQWLSGDASTIELARKVAAQADALQRAGAPSRTPSAEASENATKLAAALERGQGRRDEIVRRFNPADVDPDYRGAVETYFERLSRDARPTARPLQK